MKTIQLFSSVTYKLQHLIFKKMGDECTAPRDALLLYYYHHYFSFEFLMEHRNSVVHLHSTLLSPIFPTCLHHCQQPLIYSSHHLLHITLTSH
ncbi:unnamed protein product, partial [Heterobilharzia americana]